jgi:hypothetical protein
MRITPTAPAKPTRPLPALQPDTGGLDEWTKSDFAGVCDVTRSTPQIPPDDMPLYWFAKFLRAVAEGDGQDIAGSQRELARLGLRVTRNRPHAEDEDAKS